MNNRVFGVSIGAAAALMLLLVGGFWISGFGDCHDFSAGTVKTPTGQLNVAVAENQLDQARGLGGCKSLPKRSGMYFPYMTKQEPVFWMKGMLVPIDIVWIEGNKVVKVDAYIPPPSKGRLDEELIRYSAPRPIDAVLEVEAGKAQEYGLKPGSNTVFIKNK